MSNTVTTISLSDVTVAEEFREYRDNRDATSTAVLQELLENIDN
jgi:hypothetical protein